MTRPEWLDLVATCGDRELILIAQRPTFNHVDLVAWPDEFADWLQAAILLGVRVIYAEEVTAGEVISDIRVDLQNLHDLYGESFEAEHDAIDLMLGELAAVHGHERFGWAGEWRCEGVAHLFEATSLPDDIAAIADDLRRRVAEAPPKVALRALAIDDWETRQREHEAELERRRQQTIDALVTDDRFAACRNNAERKAVLRSLGCNLQGLNLDDLLALARKRLRDEKP